MNAPTIIKEQRPKITVADLFHMMEQGVIDPEAKFELVEGEIVPMSPQGPLHQDIQNWLGQRLTMAVSDRFWVSQGATLIVSENTALDPDICLFPVELSAKDLTGEKAALVIEIAVTSRRYDLGQKASFYAMIGVQELWVVDPKSRVTHVHKSPEPGGWRDVSTVAFDQPLSPSAAPGLALRIADAG